ncbi:asparagine synthase-related protein [Dyadobacter sp. CY323]|uniref:asparagine synthase-related protein n=1 Tax=Dyadobacter sp. CY323 TaxID=2907302 RepID=UPI001F46B3D0|nr:asparagine synthase-related protein [Dyadobacter sp. CY323]MCE6988229.1 asparagine synthase-related protein [Dyadobacter sp. CY323]
MSDSNTQNFTSFSLTDFFSKNSVGKLGICAWYDLDTQTLSISRDVFGLIPLHYFRLSDEIIAFSTDLVSLIRNPQLRDHVGINEERIAAYGSWLKEPSTPYICDTFYKGIQSVSPGHIVTLSFEGVTTAPYSVFRPSKWSHLTNVEEFGEEFRKLFLNSVNGHLNDDSQILASHLSGGMDSSSVSAAIRFLRPDKPLQTLYNISNTLDTDENLYAISVAEKIGSYHHEILQSEDDFGLLSSFIGIAGQPLATLVSPSGAASLMHFAKDLGCTKIFNGSGGDSIVGSGLEMMVKAFDNGQWELVESLVRKRVSFYAKSYKYANWDKYTAQRKYSIILHNLLFHRLATLAVQGKVKDAFGLIARFSANFKVSYSYLIDKVGKSLISKARKGNIIPTASILRSDLLRSFPNYNELNVYGLLESNSGAEQQQSMDDIFNTQTILSNEQTFSISKYYNMTNSSPFYNKELFELCLAAPDLLKYGDGIGRAHFREAMTGLLPESVRRRSTKTPVRSMGPLIALRMYSQAKSLIMDSSEIWNYVDKGKFAEQLAILQNDRIPYEQKNVSVFLVCRTISLVTWLEWYKNR